MIPVDLSYLVSLNLDRGKGTPAQQASICGIDSPRQFMLLEHWQALGGGGTMGVCREACREEQGSKTVTRSAAWVNQC